MPNTEIDVTQFTFLKNTGETGQLIIDHDWSGTSIGNIDGWPLSLRITLYNILHSGFPMFLFWGEEFLCFYNDAFRPSLGAEGKNPAIGKKAITVWEISGISLARSYKKYLSQAKQ